jgi:hypothetical protein
MENQSSDHQKSLPETRPIFWHQLVEKHLKIANLYIASLRGIALIHRSCHWTTKGQAFYGDHLLFERLYNSALENLDLAAEKLIGLFGDKALDYDLQGDLLHGVLAKFGSFDGSPHRMSLAVEKRFLKFSQEAYDAFEEGGHLTLGLADAISAIANKREEAIYLLERSLEGKK